jgi:hypothetical protein
MFFRNIGITLALATVCAFTAAAVTAGPGNTDNTAVYGKRQDRLVPAGGFRTAQQPVSGYGIDAVTPRPATLALNANRS